MNIRVALKSVGIVLLAMAFGSMGWSQEKTSLPEFFGFYALDGGQNVALYEGQGSESAKSAGIEWYSIPQNSKLQDTRPQVSTSARFVLFYTNSGEMIQSLSLHRLPFVRQIIETLPADAFSPPSRRVIDSPKLPLLAAIPELNFKLLAKPVPNQPQMVELVASPKLTSGLYVVQYSPSGGNGWFAIFSVAASVETENPFCLDLILPGGPRGLFERANSELNSTVPALASYRYSQCDSSSVTGANSGANAGGQSGSASAAANPVPWTDQSTGLMWTRSDNNADLDFDHASDYCKSLKLGGYSDWRLPEIEELTGISDPSANVPVNRPDVVALHIPGQPGPAHIKGYISISGLEMSNTGKPPADLETFDFGLGKMKLIKSNKPHRQIRALCVRKP
jgi:hypothetical protein